MRPQPIKRAVVLLGCFSAATTTLHAAEWNGSYSAKGQCFCVGELPDALNATIVPTPIGGQTVAQVCQRIGSGPTLSKVEGLFNYPVYPDAQCGNGPFTDVNQNVTAQCLGTLDGKATAQSQSCQPAGSSWDLKSAFSKAPAAAAATPVVETGEINAASDTQASRSAQESTSTAGLLDKPVVTTLSIQPDSAEGRSAKRPLKATVIRSASTAARNLPEKEPLPPFTGKDIRIDGQRYLQARKGVDASGGEPGSRIILDGLVFLRDDGTIVPTDLYRVQPQTATTKKPEKATAPAARAADTDVEATNRQITREKKRIQTLAAERDAQAKAAAKADALAQANARAAAEVDEEALALAKRRLEREAAQRARQQALNNQAPAAPMAQAQVIRSVEPDHIDAKAARNARPYRQARIAIPDSPLSPAKTTQTAVTEAAKQVGPGASDAASDNGSSVAQPGLLSALRLPNDVRASSRDFSYLEALPASFDVGGNGLVLEGSAQSHARVQYVGRIGVTATYRELMVGAGYYLTPRTADRLTVVLLAGVEYGSFELTDDQDPSIAVDFDDSGVYLGAATRFVANNRFELKAGVGYSTFFEGDAMIFGGGYYHITPRLDLVSRFELGDNDLLGIGVRFYY